MLIPNIEISLPNWLCDYLSAAKIILPNLEDRVRLVIELSRLNIEHNTGGPFAAAVFDNKGLLIAPGINLVESANCSILHAEMVAIAFAQKILNRFDLSDGGKLKYELIASTEPCAMCYGAIPWSGVSKLICSARDEDARAIGFDEGPKLKDWKQQLEKRNIEVQTDILRDDAKSVLNLYKTLGRKIYNSRNPIV